MDKSPGNEVDYPFDSLGGMHRINLLCSCLAAKKDAKRCTKNVKGFFFMVVIVIFFSFVF